MTKTAVTGGGGGGSRAESNKQGGRERSKGHQLTEEVMKAVDGGDIDTLRQLLKPEGVEAVFKAMQDHEGDGLLPNPPSQEEEQQQQALPPAAESAGSEWQANLSTWREKKTASSATKAPVPTAAATAAAEQEEQATVLRRSDVQTPPHAKCGALSL